MLDFLRIAVTPGKRGNVTVYPKFVIKKSSDLMIRGGDFYAIWVEDRGLWSREEQDAIDLIDKELSNFAKEYESTHEEKASVSYLWDSESGMIDRWHAYCQRQMRDSFHPLDETIIFSNNEVRKDNYATRKLDYPLEEGSIESYERLISTLYSPEERHKLEWAIGAIVSGESKEIQKFMVLYGSVGTGKSTIINIIEQLFEGYCSAFNSKALGNPNNSFALEAFKKNPLVAIEHDGDLSRIEDNTRLNSLISHEKMSVNEKFKGLYENRFHTFLFIGTNKPVKITDAKSGLMRRLIDVSPTGNLVPRKEYERLTKKVKFELGAIAHHCLQVYLEDPGCYDDYRPLSMMGATNDFYNFVEDSFLVFKRDDRTTLKASWEMYKTFCEDARVGYPLNRRAFKEELKNYFREYRDEDVLEDGGVSRNVYIGFKSDIFTNGFEKNPSEENSENLLSLDFTVSILDDVLKDRPAQYASESGTPTVAWSKVETKLSDIDTSRLHYVRPPEDHIVIDFDKDSLEQNLKDASKWPPTYAELSRSGKKVHLHYIYTGDVTKLSRIYEEHIEIKVFTGKSALRRQLTKCNNLPIATISSGLPLKGDDKVVNFDGITSEKTLRIMIMRNLNKEYHNFTAPSVDFIKKILDDAYASGLHYDVSDLRNPILAFAAHSSHQAQKCIKTVGQMKFRSEEPAESIDPKDKDSLPIIFYDIEVFPNLFLICWKKQGKGEKIIDMINPKPEEIERFISAGRLIGFNNRRYDNHMVYAAMMGYNNERLYSLSQSIIGNGSGFFGEAYNLSYTDIYDFCSKKQSLKKWEIELGIFHKELGLPWDKPVPKELWKQVVDYCHNDVIATEATFDARQGDWAARQILAKLANGSVNDTTNSLSAKLIFGSDKHPQSQFNYRFMGDESQIAKRVDVVAGFKVNPEYTCFDSLGRPIFPGYRFEAGKSTYRYEEIGEGGYVYSAVGAYIFVPTLDIASMHPSSTIAEKLFGEFYTKTFEEIRDARVAIKNGDYSVAISLLDGALTEYVKKLESGTAWFTADDLAQALKIVINAIYGLTAAGFDNKFRDRRNVDNIVAKRGALFMCNLRHEVEDKGYTVVHCKTDSIKIANADPEIIRFVNEYGKLYGYIFEHESTYERMCLVNDAVFVAKYATEEQCTELYDGFVPKKNRKSAGKWTATGTQFQVPYVFKTLFTKEDIEFNDLCETKASNAGDIYLDLNEGLPNVEILESRLKKLNKKYYEYPESERNSPNNLDVAQLVSEISKLETEIAAGHNYVFIGKVSRFTPMQGGVGAGVLVRGAKDKHGVKAWPSLGGAKGYRWMESEMVQSLHLEDKIDMSYYQKLADDAVDAITQYCDFDWFVTGDICDNAVAILPF